MCFPNNPDFLKLSKFSANSEKANFTKICLELYLGGDSKRRIYVMYTVHTAHREPRFIFQFFRENQVHPEELQVAEEFVPLRNSAIKQSHPGIARSKSCNV